MLCARCGKDCDEQARYCPACGSNLAQAALRVVAGEGAGLVHYLRRGECRIGRATENDLVLQDPAVSRQHAVVRFEADHFVIEDLGSRLGLFVDGARVQSAQLAPGSLVKLGETVLRFAPLEPAPAGPPPPTVEHQEMLLPVIEALNSTRVLSEVLDQIVAAVMRLTRAERGFLLLAESGPPSPGEYEPVPGLRLRVAHTHRDQPTTELSTLAGAAGADPRGLGLSTSILARVRGSGETLATGNALADPGIKASDSINQLSLRTIVCAPIRSPAAGSHDVLGVIYADNQATSGPLSDDCLGAVEALCRHAALAIENARFAEREERTIRELREARDRAQEASRAKSAFMATMSHELHTPLNAIIGYGEILHEHLDELGQRELLPDLDRILAAGQHLLRMIDDVLDMASLESGQVRLRPEPIDLEALLDELAGAMRPRAEKRGNALEVRLAGDAGAIEADPRRLRQILSHLLSNACKFTEGGEVLLEAQRESGEGAWIRFRVCDTGIGMTPDQVARAFDAFSQADSSATRKYEGMGLGLAVSRRLCEAMGGRLEVESEPGRGSRFTLRLPVRAEAAAAQPPDHSSRISSV